MGKRIRGLVLLLVLLGGGILLGSALTQWRDPVGPGIPLPPLPLLEGRVRVEVLNAGGLAGVARDATEALRDRGFDVVYYGNAGTFTQDSSVVMDRVGRLEAARVAADLLGIRAVVVQPDPNLYVDLTVRLGPEWSLPRPAPRRAQDARPWWDPRRYFPGARAPRPSEPGNR